MLWNKWVTSFLLMPWSILRVSHCAPSSLCEKQYRRIFQLSKMRWSCVDTGERALLVCGWGSWYTSVYFLSTSIVFSNLCGFYITQKGEDWQWYIAHCNNWSRGSVSTFFQFLVYILQKFENIKWRSVARISKNGFLPAEYVYQGSASRSYTNNTHIGQ